MSIGNCEYQSCLESILKNVKDINQLNYDMGHFLTSSLQVKNFVLCISSVSHSIVPSIS